MEALMKDTGGPDHIIVRVKLPSGAVQTPVSKNDLFTSPPGKSYKACHFIQRAFV